jgi:hypothetical protein
VRVLVIPCTLYSSLVCLAKHLMGTDTGIGLLSADSGFFDGNMRFFFVGLVQNRFYGGF